MNIFTKIITSFITLTFAVIGGIWTATTVLLHTMDSKVADAKIEIHQEMEVRKTARDQQFKDLQSHIDQRFTDNKEYVGQRLDKLEYLVRTK
jgi:hypothetical protein